MVATEINMLSRFVSFVLARPDHNDLISFRATKTENDRYLELCGFERNRALSVDEQFEIKLFETAEHMIRQAKLSSYKALQSNSVA